MPHIVRLANLKGFEDSFSVYAVFMLICGIEISRIASNLAIPEDLSVAYFNALAEVPKLIGCAAISVSQWDDETTRIVLASLSVSKNHPELAYFLVEADEQRRKIIYQGQSIGELIPLKPSRP